MTILEELVEKIVFTWEMRKDDPTIKRKTTEFFVTEDEWCSLVIELAPKRHLHFQSLHGLWFYHTHADDLISVYHAPSVTAFIGHIIKPHSLKEANNDAEQE